MLISKKQLRRLFYFYFLLIIYVERASASEGEHLFGSKLFQGIRSHVQNANLVYSPFSIRTLLEMVYYGSEGDTKYELKNLMGVVENEQNSYQKLMELSMVKGSSGVTLVSANKIFIHKSFQIKSEYSELLTKSFSSSIESVDFGSSTSSAKKVNDWVSASTNGKIKDIVTSDSFDSDTRLFLVNAIYFKGSWKHEFDQKKTIESKFYLRDKNKVKVQMMYIEQKFFYRNLHEIDASAVALPYTNGDLYMLIILPDNINGLNQIEVAIRNPTFFDFINKMSISHKVQVHLPKFKIETSLDLTESLKSIGLSSMFSGNANLGGMSNEQLQISSVFQKSFIEVNEKGTEAAAASGAEVVLKSAGPRVIQFRADRPFYFQIFNIKNKMVLFSGICENPNETKENTNSFGWLSSFFF